MTPVDATDEAAIRSRVAQAHTLVVKIGSSSLTRPSGHLDADRLEGFVSAVARMRLLDARIVVVSSGAIAAGFGPLGFSSRPDDLAPSCDPSRSSAPAAIVGFQSKATASRPRPMTTSSPGRAP